MTLTDFLLARIADDERDHYPFQPSDFGDFKTPAQGCAPCNIGLYDGAMCRDQRECEAKREIVYEHYFMPRHESRDFGFEDGNCVTCRKQGPCPTLQLLALPYANHPDYRDEWKP